MFKYKLVCSCRFVLANMCVRVCMCFMFVYVLVKGFVDKFFFLLLQQLTVKYCTHYPDTDKGTETD